ncbi:phosphotransferase family protein [Streptacidiphilus jiangxiensis]|uniref:Predicted kinase, aminoglycoside phosphotransferase (APT) family n=1 Tax=Streptacidiphilus jiangxiensis TaxID=235985 RepID=A0A1H7U2Z1_STRJI|nr:phosphotransferase family protein [Streptacidiphilus jiangxiensis]SEL90617.1 Predicted kinase, aminoglycoside phosphotransferase (APT) family [Streptacidiphilus jiangxiensis]
MSTPTPPGLDLDRLRAHLGTGPLTATLISGGKSNLTYRLTDGNHRWVLRRPPLGHVLATAHDMVREHTVIAALATTPVPVPRVHLLCEDTEVVGAPFYLMDEVPGTVYRTADDAAGLGAERARALSFRLIDVLADLHAVEPAAAGLAEFGRPDGYMERQVSRWHRQFEASRSRDIPGMEELQQRLSKGVPAPQRATVVHGDYRLDNTIAADDDSIAAVLDWEMATLGDPLADVGLMKVYWDIAGNMPGNPVAGAVSPALGFPAMDELVERYSATTGLDLTPLPWYTAFAQYKLAVIAEGIHYRFSQGKTVGDGFAHLGAMVPPLVALALDTMNGKAGD